MSEQKGPMVAGNHGHFSPQAFVSWTFSKSNNITWSFNYKGIYFGNSHDSSELYDFSKSNCQEHK